MSLHVEIIAVTLFRQNCTLMWDDETNEAVFTDVGGNVPRLLEEAEKRGLHVKAIWLTHGHLDHVGGVAEMTAGNPKIEVLGPHEADRFLLANLTEITKQYNFPPTKPFMPTRWLKEGDELTEKYITTLNEEQQEACNQLNRRTEFLVLRTTYGMFDENGNLKQLPKMNKKEENTGGLEEFILE